VVADQHLGAEHRVAQAQHARLAHEAADHVIGFEGLNQLQQFVFVTGLQFGFQLIGGIEMVLDRPLVAAGDKDHVANAGFVGFLDRVLDQRLVHHRHHFLGLRLCGGKETGAQSGDRKYRFGNLGEFIHRRDKGMTLKFAEFCDEKLCKQCACTQARWAMTDRTR
jgi:hypothetical protein